MKPELVFPTQLGIVEVLLRHRLVKLRESVECAFGVGNFAKGCQNNESDVDVLLEVTPRDRLDAPEL